MEQTNSCPTEGNDRRLMMFQNDDHGSSAATRDQNGNHNNNRMTKLSTLSADEQTYNSAQLTPGSSSAAISIHLKHIYYSHAYALFVAFVIFKIWFDLIVQAQTAISLLLLAIIGIFIGQTTKGSRGKAQHAGNDCNSGDDDSAEQQQRDNGNERTTDFKKLAKGKNNSNHGCAKPLLLRNNNNNSSKKEASDCDISKSTNTNTNRAKYLSLDDIKLNTISSSKGDSRELTDCAQRREPAHDYKCSIAIGGALNERHRSDSSDADQDNIGSSDSKSSRRRGDSIGINPDGDHDETSSCSGEIDWPQSDAINPISAAAADEQAISRPVLADGVVSPQSSSLSSEKDLDGSGRQAHSKQRYPRRLRQRPRRKSSGVNSSSFNNSSSLSHRSRETITTTDDDENKRFRFNNRRAANCLPCDCNHRPMGEAVDGQSPLDRTCPLVPCSSSESDSEHNGKQLALTSPSTSNSTGYNSDITNCEHGRHRSTQQQREPSPTDDAAATPLLRAAGRVAADGP